MIRFDDYIEERLRKEEKTAGEFWAGYDKFKIGVILKEARLEAGLSQDEVARKIKTTKSVVSRMENHAEDIRLSSLEKFARALNKEIHISII